MDITVCMEPVFNEQNRYTTQAHQSFLELMMQGGDLGTDVNPNQLPIRFGRDVYRNRDELELVARGVAPSVESEFYARAIRDGMVPKFNDYSVNEFSRLLRFTEGSRINLIRSVGEAVKYGDGVLSPTNPDQIQKRAGYLSVFSQLGPELYTIDELEAEAEVKEHFPWVWIDALPTHNDEQRTYKKDRIFKRLDEYSGERGEVRSRWQPLGEVLGRDFLRDLENRYDLKY